MGVRLLLQTAVAVLVEGTEASVGEGGGGGEKGVFSHYSIMYTWCGALFLSIDHATGRYCATC